MPLQQQTIAGKNYNMYSQQANDARDADNVQQAGVAGTAAGTQAGKAKLAEWNTTHPGQAYGQNEDRARNALYALMNQSQSSSSGSSFGNGGAPSPYQPPQGTSAPPVTIAPPDTSAATANAFARAKDQVGLETRGALTGLAGAMAGRGTVGSGVEGRGMSSVVNKGQGELGDTTREQTIQSTNLAQKNAELAYTGGITQRGQDLSHNEAINNQNLTARGQDMNYAIENRRAQQQSMQAQANAILQSLRY